MAEAEAAVRGLLLTVAYRGGPFSGFAAQANARTVEGELGRCVREHDATASPLRYSSRTDAGVHAEGQMVAFDSTHPTPPRGWLAVLNRALPAEVAVRRARGVPSGFDPRFRSLWKRYRYRVLLDPVRDPTLEDRAWRVGCRLDVARMERACADVRGTHDFAAYRGASDTRTSTVRTLTRVEIARGPDPRQLELVVEGTAFLYNMIRILAGSLVDVGRGHLDERALGRALTTRARADLGQTAPARGLCLEHVELALPDDAGPPWPS